MRKDTKERLDRAKALVENGHAILDACQLAGISPNTYYALNGPKKRLAARKKRKASQGIGSSHGSVADLMALLKKKVLEIEKEFLAAFKAP